MKKRKIYVIVISAISLIGTSSCSVIHKTYKVPQIEHTELLYGHDRQTDSITIASIPWRNYFADTLLVNLIDEGIRNNFDLRIAQTRIRAAESSLGEARNAFFPEIGLTGQVEHLRTSNGNRGKDVMGYSSTEYTLGITASWELDIWGKLNSRRKSEYAVLLGSHAYRNLIQTSLIANIAVSYYSLLALDEELLVTCSTVELMKENLSVMTKLMEAGLQTGAAVEQSKVTLYNTQSHIPDLEYQIAEMEHTLCTLVGRMPGEIKRNTFNEQIIVDQLHYGVPAQMLAQRPDVQEAEAAFRSAFELTNTARASFYPSVKLTSGTIGYNSLNTLSEFFHPENLFLNLVGGLTQPLFNRGRLRSEMEIAKAREDEALLSFQRTVLSAGKEVTDILAEFHSATQKNDTRKNQVEAARNAVDYTQKLLLAGDVDYTEVLTAEESYLSSRLAQVSDKLQQILCTVRLYRALGGGINNSNHKIR